MNNDNPLAIIKKYLDYIDSGKFYRKPFRILYAIFAIINVLFPIGVLIGAISNDVFDSGGDFIAAFIIMWVILFIVSIIGAIIWWIRKDQVDKITSENDDFVAVPVVAHFVKTYGEWLGTSLAILGTTFALIARLFLGNSWYQLSRMIDVPYLGADLYQIFISPLMGFGIIIFSRFIAEFISSFTIIANNTKNGNREVKNNEEIVIETIDSTPPPSPSNDDLFK